MTNGDEENTPMTKLRALISHEIKNSVLGATNNGAGTQQGSLICQHGTRSKPNVVATGEGLYADRGKVTESSRA